MIKKLVSTTLLGVAVMIGFSSQKAHGLALPAILNFLPTVEVAAPKSEAGPDGNNRFLWDYFSTSGSSYLGSALWILDPAGNVIGTGDTMVPASVGGIAGTVAISFTQLHVNADNTTTLAFQFGGGPLLGGGSQISAFGTWTYNAQGKLIAFSGPTGFITGPKKGLQIADMKFQGDHLVVIFQPANQAVGSTIVLGQGPYTVWVIDHFGNVVSAVGPQGPYANYVLGSVTLSGSDSAPNQLWHWLSVVGTGAKEGFALSVQEFNSSGASLSGVVYGPFN